MPGSAVELTLRADFFLGSSVIHFAILEYLSPEDVPAIVFFSWLSRRIAFAHFGSL